MNISKILIIVLSALVLLYGFWHHNGFTMIAAGVAVFFFGMIYLEKGFKLYTGGFLEKLLKKATNKLWKSIGFGIFTTSLFQSSSLVAVIIISFLSAGIISLEAGIGIMFGANIGSTAGAWMIALFGLNVKMLSYGMPLLVIGLLLSIGKQENIYTGLGYILTGIGFIFLAIHYIKEGLNGFNVNLDFLSISYQGFYHILLYVLFGAIMTVIMQSTNALMVLVFAALTSEQLGYESAVAMTIGSNIGTTATAILGSLSANIQGKKLAIAHVLFNVITSLFVVVFFYSSLELVDYVAHCFNVNQENHVIKLAIFHTLFNIIGVILFIPFIRIIVNFLNKIFIDKISDIPLLNLSASNTSHKEQSIYLNEAVTNYPDPAMRAMTKECSRLYRNTLELICYSIYLSGESLRNTNNINHLIIESKHKTNTWSIKGLYDRHIKGIYADIMHFCLSIEGTLPQSQAQELFSLKIACRSFIQAVQYVKPVYKNMGRCLQSKDKKIQYHYNELRLCLAVILKKIDHLGVKRNYSNIKEDVQKLKLELYERDLNINNALKKLTQSHQIDSEMAGILIMDSQHVHDSCVRLIDGAIIMLMKGVDETKSD